MCNTCGPLYQDATISRQPIAHYLTMKKIQFHLTGSPKEEWLESGEFNISVTPTRIQVLFIVLLCQKQQSALPLAGSSHTYKVAVLVPRAPCKSDNALQNGRSTVFSLFGLILRQNKTFLEAFQQTFPTSHWPERGHMPPLKPVPEKRNGRLMLRKIYPKSYHGGLVTQAKLGFCNKENGGDSSQLGSQQCLLQIPIMSGQTLGRKYITKLCIRQIIYHYRK